MHAVIQVSPDGVVGSRDCHSVKKTTSQNLSPQINPSVHSLIKTAQSAVSKNSRFFFGVASCEILET